MAAEQVSAASCSLTLLTLDLHLHFIIISDFSVADAEFLFSKAIGPLPIISA